MTSFGVELKANVSRSGSQMSRVTGLSIQYLVIYIIVVYFLVI